MSSSRKNIVNKPNLKNRKDGFSGEYLTREEYKEMKQLGKKLRIKSPGMVPKSFFNEGIGSIVQLCNRITSYSLNKKDCHSNNLESNEFDEFSSESMKSDNDEKFNKKKRMNNNKKDNEIHDVINEEIEDDNYETSDISEDSNTENYANEEEERNNKEKSCAKRKPAKKQFSINEMLELQKKTIKSSIKPDLYGRDLQDETGKTLSDKIGRIPISKERSTLLDLLEKKLRTLLNKITESNMPNILSQIKSIAKENSVNGFSVA